MDWKRILAELSEAGISQPFIAETLNVAQGTIGDIATGRTAQPRYELGAGILRLHEQYTTRQAAN